MTKSQPDILVNPVEPGPRSFIRALFGVRPITAGALIFALAFAIRVAFVLHTSLDLQIPAETRYIALALLNHRGFADPYKLPTGPTAHSTPFLPVLVAGIYWVFGSGYNGELVRCLLLVGVLAMAYALLPFFAAKMRLPASVGILAGLICAIFPFKRTSETVSFNDEPVVAVALLLLLVYSYSLIQKPRFAWRDAVLYGVAWGLLFYVSASALPIFLGCLLLLSLLRPDRQRSQMALRTGLALLAAGLIVTPWTLRTYARLHALVFMRSNFGLEFSLANSDGARPSLKQNLRSGHHAALHPVFNENEARLVGEMGEPAYNRRKTAQAFQWVASHPGTFIKFTLVRFLYFWGGDPLDYATAIPNAALSLFALVGLVMLWREQPIAGRLLACVLGCFPLIYYLIQTMPRYSLSIHPLIAFCAAYGLWRLAAGRSMGRETA
ncbi:MAG TPA: hypothetical protein VLW25_05855 [Bryobacteraceae bacterium]|nr:hypothetical protein [Bryobacteraceae bacterium]